jgi:hypothetical protein
MGERIAKEFLCPSAVSDHARPPRAKPATDFPHP